MYCSKCGKKIEEGINFCSHCGNKVNLIILKDMEIKVDNSENNHQKKRNRNIYIFIFLLLILPAVISKIFFYLGYPIISYDLAKILTVISRLGLIILTIWYAIKINLKVWQTILLGILTLLPLMAWISFIILLNINNIKSSKFFSFPRNFNKKGTLIFFIIIIIFISFYFIGSYYDTKNIKNIKINNTQIPHEYEIVDMKISYISALGLYDYDWEYADPSKNELADIYWNEYKGCYLKFLDEKMEYSYKEEIISKFSKNYIDKLFHEKILSELPGDKYCVQVFCNENLKSQLFCFNK